ncbi:ODFP1 protein, partial [Polioptila caerulea]|nr:ODFP1 protein [Polioptila caerulea]
SRLRRLSRMLSTCCSDNSLALIDVKGFDPRDITVIVKDGKVIVTAEHREEHNTCTAKTRNYKKFTKEFCLPPGVCESDVTYTV